MFNSARMRGNIPGWAENIIKDIISPPVPWRVILQQFIQSKRKGGSSWLPPNKKYMAHNIYLPSYYEEFLKLAVAIDTSGSIGEGDLKLFLGALNQILCSIRNYEIVVLQCDTRITDERVFYTGQEFKPEEFKIKGRGGTDFRPVFERLEKETGLDGILFFTDGNGTYPKEVPQVPVLWVLVEDYAIPFGEKIIIRREK